MDLEQDNPLISTTAVDSSLPGLLTDLNRLLNSWAPICKLRELLFSNSTVFYFFGFFFLSGWL